MVNFGEGHYIYWLPYRVHFFAIISFVCMAESILIYVSYCQIISICWFVVRSCAS